MRPISKDELILRLEIIMQKIESVGTAGEEGIVTEFQVLGSVESSLEILRDEVLIRGIKEVA